MQSDTFDNSVASNLNTSNNVIEASPATKAIALHIKKWYSIEQRVENGDEEGTGFSGK